MELRLRYKKERREYLFNTLLSVYCMSYDYYSIIDRIRLLIALRSSKILHSSTCRTTTPQKRGMAIRPVYSTNTAHSAPSVQSSPVLPKYQYSIQIKWMATTNAVNTKFYYKNSPRKKEQGTQLQRKLITAPPCQKYSYTIHISQIPLQETPRGMLCKYLRGPREGVT